MDKKCNMIKMTILACWSMELMQFQFRYEQVQQANSKLYMEEQKPKNSQYLLNNKKNVRDLALLYPKVYNKAIVH